MHHRLVEKGVCGVYRLEAARYKSLSALAKLAIMLTIKKELIRFYGTNWYTMWYNLHLKEDF
jgi:hypothetical protein